MLVIFLWCISKFPAGFSRILHMQDPSERCRDLWIFPARHFSVGNNTIQCEYEMKWPIVYERSATRTSYHTLHSLARYDTMVILRIIYPETPSLFPVILSLYLATTSEGEPGFTFYATDGAFTCFHGDGFLYISSWIFQSDQISHLSLFYT